MEVASVTDNTHLELISPWPITSVSFGPLPDGSFWVVRLSLSWIGTERIIAASIDPTDIPDQWKVQTISVVMR